MRSPKRWLAIGASVALLALARTGAADPAGSPVRAVLPSRLNGVDVGEMTVVFDGADLLVRVEDLAAQGVRDLGGADRVVAGERFVSLGSLAPDATWSYDDVRLMLTLVLAPRLLPTTRRDLAPERPGGISTSSDPSAFVNYSVTVDESGRWSGFSEAGLSLGSSLLSSSLTRLATGQLVRGMTSLTLDQPSRRVRWVVGDHLATGGELGGSALLAGLAVSREFDLDPYFYRYPGVGVSGATLTPTRADIYLNGRLVAQEMLAPGTFDFSHLPVESGQGEATVVLHDALGGERILTSSYSLSTSLLARGLSDFSYQLGFRRENPGEESFAYGRPAFIGRHRVGLSDHLTAGVRLEGAEGIVSGGAQAATSFGCGELDVSAAASGGRGSRGFAGSLRASFRFGRLSLGVVGQRISDHYATLSRPVSQDRPVVEMATSAGLALGRWGGLTVQYARQRWRDAGSTRRMTISHNTRLFDGASLHLTATRGRSAVAGETTEVWATLTWSFGRTSSAEARWHHGDNGTTLSAGIQQSPPLGAGFGYRIEGTTGGGSPVSATADAQYRSPVGIYRASYRSFGDGESAYVTAAGGVVAIGGSLFATRPVEQAFALLRVPGVAGIAATHRNQVTGRTDRQGEILVPDLIPYYGNALGITDTDLPIDYLVDSVRQVVSPPFRGGAIVTFPVRRLRAFAGKLRISYRGVEAIPAFGRLSVAVNGQQRVSDIGRAGTFYLEDIPPGTWNARIDYLGTSCELPLTAPESQEAVLQLGVLLCRTESDLPSAAAPATPAHRTALSGESPVRSGPLERTSAAADSLLTQ